MWFGPPSNWRALSARTIRIRHRVPMWLRPNKNRRVFQNSPRDGDPLALSAAEPRAALSNDSIVAVWQRQDKILGECCLRSGSDLFFGNIGEPIADVIPDGIVEQDIFLGNH